MTCFSSLMRTEWEEFARSRTEVREQELVDRQGWAWKIGHHLPSLVRVCVSPKLDQAFQGNHGVLRKPPSISLYNSSVLGSRIGALENSHLEKALIIFLSLSFPTQA